MVTAESKIFSVAVSQGKSQEATNFVYKVRGDCFLALVGFVLFDLVWF